MDEKLLSRSFEKSLKKAGLDKFFPSVGGVQVDGEVYPYCFEKYFDPGNPEPQTRTCQFFHQYKGNLPELWVRIVVKKNEPVYAIIVEYKRRALEIPFKNSEDNLRVIYDFSQEIQSFSRFQVKIQEYACGFSAQGIQTDNSAFSIYFFDKENYYCDEEDLADEMVRNLKTFFDDRLQESIRKCFGGILV